MNLVNLCAASDQIPYFLPKRVLEKVGQSTPLPLRVLLDGFNHQGLVV